MSAKPKKAATGRTEAGHNSVEAALPPGMPPTPALVTREQLALAIGKHSRTVRRWERTRLAPALVLGEDGVHRFDVSRVRELVELHERSTPVTADSFDDGETTAAVFELFAQSVEPADVVVRLKLPAFAVEGLRRRWVALRGGYVVPHAAAVEISAMRGETISDSDALLRNLRETLPTTCEQCHDEIGNRCDGSFDPAFCGVCSKQLSARHAAQVAVAAAGEKAARARRKAQQRADAEDERRSDPFLDAMRAPPEERVGRMLAATGKQAVSD
jgi:hypothetical protein